MEKDSKILVLGATGLVGSAYLRLLQKEGFTNILTPTRNQVDLTSKYLVDSYFGTHQPHYVVMCAGKVGGILANNTYPSEFLFENAIMLLNVINACHKFSVKKSMVLGSSCIYPKHCPQPIKEEYLLTGSLEPTNEPYALAKIMAIKLAQAYSNQYGTNIISVMPCNVYGVGDNYHPYNGHIIASMISRFEQAKADSDDSVVVWGTGTPLREFIFAIDLADAMHFLMCNYDESMHINVGTGEEISVKDLAFKIKELTNFVGYLDFVSQMPDGTPRKLLDSTRLNSLGWKHKTTLDEGLKIMYSHYLPF